MVNTTKMAGPWITDLERETVAKMMLNGWDNYNYVEKFESSFAQWHGRKYCLMTPCCTHAIHLLLLALGIKEGDEVIVPDCTWTGSVAPVTYVNAIPVFADIDPNTWCLDPSSIRSRITNKTKAIIVVDLYGNMGDMEELESISSEFKIPLIEDAAEALGSKYKGMRAGKFGIGGVHSFHRTKTMTTGEGGALLIDDDDIYERAKFLRDHGRSKDIPYYILEATPKYMPSNLQASLAWAQFQRIDELIEKKRYFLHQYKNKLKEVDDIQMNLENLDVFNGVWATSLVFGESHKILKERAIKELTTLGVPSRSFFYPLSSMPAYEKYKTGSAQLNPNCYDISARAITLPSSYSLTDEDIEEICSGIKKILNQ